MGCMTDTGRRIAALFPALLLSACQWQPAQNSSALLIIGTGLVVLGVVVALQLKLRRGWLDETLRRVKRAEKKSQREADLKVREVRQEMEQRVREIQQRTSEDLEKRIQEIQQQAKQDLGEQVRQERESARQSVVRAVQETRETARREVEQKVREAEDRLQQPAPSPAPADMVLDEELVPGTPEMAAPAEEELPAEIPVDLGLDLPDDATEREVDLSDPDAREEFERLVLEETERKAEEAERRQAHKQAVKRVKQQFQRRESARKATQEQAPGGFDEMPTAVHQETPDDLAPARQDALDTDVTEPVAAADAELPVVLLAEDSRTMRQIFKLVLAGEPCKLVSVPSGREAVDMAREIHPALVIADLSLDDHDGYYICKQLKADPALARVPVVLLHGASTPHDEDRAQAVGADGELEKPFHSQDLVDKIKDYL